MTSEEQRTIESVLAELAQLRDRIELAESSERERLAFERALTEIDDAQRRLSRENQLMAEIGQIISQSLDITEVYEQFADRVRSLISFDRLAISLIDHETGTMTNTYVVGGGLSEGATGEAIPIGDNIRPLIETREGVLSNLAPEETSEIGQGFPSRMFVPLIANNEVIATLGFRSSEYNAYARRDLVLAERVATQIAGAIRSSLLYDRSRRAEELLTEQAAELARSNEDLEQFAYVASHDLQEPLRMVSSYVDLLGSRYEGRLDADADDFIRFAVDGAHRMEVLINDLLTYSKVGTAGLEVRPTDCGEVVGSALANLEAAIDQTGASVVAESLPTVIGDSSQLVQLFQNLIGNSLKFRGEETPRVTVRGQRQGDEWIISVSDNGIGVDAEYAEKVFVIFQRLHGRGDYAGTGIGLAICKKIVERCGGRIWLDETYDSGACFSFTLPAA